MEKTVQKSRLKSERGETATEYMMMVSVVVIAVVAGAYAFVPTFTNGVFNLSSDVSQILDEHGSTKGGWGLAAANASHNGNGRTTIANPAEVSSNGANAANGGVME